MPALIQREEISPPMQEALRRHIMRERERRKQEEKEAEKDFERRKIEEERKRKEEEDSVNLEQIKEQLSGLQKKLENLKQEKHQLFAELKRVLHEEDKRKQKLREQSELQAASQAHYSHAMSSMGGYQMIPGGRYQAHPQIPVPFMQGQSSPHVHPSLRHSMAQQQSSPAAHQAVKRPLSPASPQPGIMQMYPRGGVASGGHTHLPSTPQHQKYESGYGHPPSGHFSPLSNLSNSSSNQSGIHSASNRHMGAMHGSSSPSGRSSGQRSPYSMPIGKQLEHASKKSGFGDDSISSMTSPRGRSNIRMLPQGPLMSQQPSLSQLSQSPRVRSGSPGKYQMNPEKSHSPFHPSQLPGARYYKQ